MKTSPRLITPRKSLLLFALGILAVALIPSNAHAGNGTFRNGRFNFCVSVRFNASAAQLQQIRTAFESGSQVLADATDGQHRFGHVTIVNDSGASESAEYWVNPQSGRAYATQGRYGVRGEHVMLYFPDNFQAQSGADGDAYTVAHEHAHHAYGVLDEYSGPGGAAECAAPPDTAALTFCLMDNYFTRGGNFGTGSTYTLNEFCVAGNHDPDADTFQERRNSRSCWAQIGSHPKRAAGAPSGLPTDAAPGAQVVDFEEGTGGLRVVLVLDRSGSMSTEQRLEFAKRGANQFINFLRDGDQVGIVSFDDFAQVNFALTTISGAGTKNSAKAAVNAISLGGSTNIGGGLQAALNQITSQSEHSCNNIIVLLSDGDHNTGTHPSAVIPSLQDEGVTVLSVGVGSGISSSGQATLQNVANQTGGKFFRVSNAFNLVGLFLRLVFESLGNGLLTRSPETLSPGQVKEVSVSVEQGVQSATFAIAIANASDDITLSLRSPSGDIINASDAATNPNVEFITESNSLAFRIRSPEAGQWKMVLTAGSVSSGVVEVLAFADHDGVQLNLSVTKDTLTFPEAIEIQATPRFGGESVVGAIITGFATRPNGSTVAISLSDDGSAATGDAEAGDGTYSARFNQYNGNGTYTFDLTAVINNAKTYHGEKIFDFAASNEKPVEPFTRAGSTTAVVTGVPAVSGSANLSITKAVAPAGTVTAGTELTYTLTVANSGPNTATGVVVTDNLPLSTSFVSCDSTGSGSCGGTGNNRTISFSALASGGSATITLKAQVVAGVADGTTITNTATVTSPVDDPNSANNLATATSTTPPAKLIQFSIGSQSVDEGTGSVEVVVTRSGDSSGEAEIEYATSNGSAVDTSDYTTSLGTLHFAAGVTEERITVLLTDDVFIEGAETLNLTLTAPVGAGLGTPFTHVLTVNDNDSSGSPSNPLNLTRFFVEQHYHDLLNRKADAQGLDFWVGQIEQCRQLTSTQAREECLAQQKHNVSAAFFLSIEYQETGHVIFCIYKASFPESPSRPRGLPRFREFLRDTQQIQRGVIVGKGDWVGQLERNTQTFAVRWVQRAEFLSLFPADMSAEQFVDALFANAGVTPTPADRSSALNAFGGGGTAGRASALLSVVESTSVCSHLFNPSFVLMEYFAYLRRNPDDPPDANFRGYDFWLRKLDSLSLPGEDVRDEGVALDRIRRAEMVTAFLVSLEYMQRFGPPDFSLRN